MPGNPQDWGREISQPEAINVAQWEQEGWEDPSQVKHLGGWSMGKVSR